MSNQHGKLAFRNNISNHASAMGALSGQSTQYPKQPIRSISATESTQDAFNPSTTSMPRSLESKLVNPNSKNAQESSLVLEDVHFVWFP